MSMDRVYKQAIKRVFTEKCHGDRMAVYWGSDDTINVIAMRFFRYLSALSYEEAQRLCNVDFEKDVAFVAVIGRRDNEEIVGTGAYFLNPSTNLAEVAYMIVPEWQGSGLGAAPQRIRNSARFARLRGGVPTD